MNELVWMDPRSQRDKWGEGEWCNEPDKVQWTDPATGLVCLAKRHPELGHWCGYVGVAKGHPWHSKTYDDITRSGDDYGPDVHGGLTYASGCSDGPPEESICHIPEPGQADHLWWLGFDMGHAGDFSPFMNSERHRKIKDEVAAKMRLTNPEYVPIWEDVYRDLPYVKEQCTRLAQQVAAAVIHEPAS